MKNFLKQFATEDWIIVFAAFFMLALATFLPEAMPKLPSKIADMNDIINVVYMYVFLLAVTAGTSIVLNKDLKMACSFVHNNIRISTCCTINCRNSNNQRVWF